MAGIENLHLSDDDEKVLDFQEQGRQEKRADVNLCLMGRFLMQKPIRTHMMKERLATIWEPVRGVAIREVEKGVFVFQFFHKLDMQKVIKGCPWAFDNYLLVLGQIGASEVLAEVPLFHVNFWVQVHELPVGFMSMEVGKGLGNYIGEFIEYDAKNNSTFWRTYMRIRVRVDMRKPMKKGKKIRKDGGEVKQVRFKYERLGMFSFFCGILGHAVTCCELLFQKEEDDGTRGWGPDVKLEKKRYGGTGRCRWLREQSGEEVTSENHTEG